MGEVSRKRKMQIAGVIIVLLLICILALWLRVRLTGRGIGVDLFRETGMADKNYYGFVHYTHYAGRENLPEYMDKVQAAGAGWIQAEGPETASCSVTWDEVVPWDEDCAPENAPDLDDPEVYRWESMDWVKEVADKGMGAVIEISTGGGANSTSCWTKACTGGVCPPKDEHWGKWYTFVRHVVEHFDGAHVDAGGNPVPEVRYFTSVEEAGEGAIVPFYGGSAEDLLGARLDRTDPRNPRIIVNDPQEVGGSRAVPPGIVPVSHLAVGDANPKARYVLGAVVGIAAKFAYAHLYSEWVNGKSEEDLDALARSYNVRPASELRKPPGGRTYSWEELFSSNNSALVDAQKLILPSFAVAEHYDAYGIHLYDSMYGFLHDAFPVNDNNPNIAFMAPEGYQQAIRWVTEQMPRKVWITGTGLWPNPTIYGDYSLEEKQRYAAGHVLKTLAVAHATGVEWMTYSSVHQPGKYGTLADTMWWGLWPYEATSVEEGTPAAGAFGRMAKFIPTADSVTRKKVFEYRGGTRASVQTDARDVKMETLPVSDPWSGDGPSETSAVLYSFDMADDAPSAHVAVGWCVDQDPMAPETFETHGDCGEIHDICQALGLSQDAPVSVYGVDGSVKQETACGQADIVFRQAPFILAWGDASANPWPVEDNKPPMVQLSFMHRVPVGVQFLLDASTSYDPDGDPLEFHWSQQEGPEVLQMTPSPDGSTLEVLAEELGPYAIALQITDGKTWTEEATATFEVADEAMACVPASTVHGAGSSPSGILSLLIILSPALRALLWRGCSARNRDRSSL